MALELNLAGKKALITGASEGIGEGIARRLGAEGVDLYLAARSEDKLNAVADAVRTASGVEVVAIPLDLSISENQQALAARAADADILINNAGAVPNGTIDQIDEATWRKAYDLKLFGYINMCRSFYVSMRERGGGVILNINGNGGEVQAADYVAGACANAAIMGLTRALGGSSHFDNIRVLAINPGATATERIIRMSKKAAADRLGDESRYQEILGSFAFERIATVDEIADMAAFLVSDLSAYTSGTIVTIDGGHVYNRKMF